jgi:hypothetical protein
MASGMPSKFEAGVTDQNSGGNVLFLSPGLRYSMDKWSALRLVDIPVIKDLNGFQAEPVGGFSPGFL